LRLLKVDGIMSAFFCRPIIAVASYCGMIKLWQYRKRCVPDKVVFLSSTCKLVYDGVITEHVSNLKVAVNSVVYSVSSQKSFSA